MSNTITPTVFYRTLNVEGLESFYREAGPRDGGSEVGSRSAGQSARRSAFWCHASVTAPKCTPDNN